MAYEGVKRSRNKHFNARNIGGYLARRDGGWFCHYCGCEVHPKPSRVDALRKPAKATVDHKDPLCKGGADNPSNMVLACARCNDEKGDMDYEEFINRNG